MYMDYKPVRGYNAYLTMGSTDANTGLDVGLLILELGERVRDRRAGKGSCARSAGGQN